jgi:predicted glycosyltransferase involved in capsule biosynthesis
MDVSVIYPLHITRRNRYLLNRISACLNNTSQSLPNAEHIIVLSGVKAYKNQATQIISKLKHPVTTIDYTTPTTPYSPGTARNVAISHSTKNHLLFWDIDLLGSQELFSNIPKHIKEISNSKKQFEMYPCLYLCKEYTKSLNGDLEQAWHDATQLKTNSIEHFAMATSTILCDKKHFIKLGEFDESFIGHMGEDLDLLNRLAVAYGKFDFEANHCENTPSKIASELKGFRKHFLNYSAPHLEDKIFTVHLYHNTHIRSKYKSKNKNNTNLLLIKLITTKKTNTHPASMPKKNLPKYLTILPKIQHKKSEQITRKIRKLLSTPKKFFQDIM